MPQGAAPGPVRAGRVVLVGMPGAGKTVVGQALARRLGWPFRDLDEQVAREAGRPVGDLIRTRGEDAFRRQEAAALAAALGCRPIIVASGGGAPCWRDNLERMRHRSLVVWLDASHEVLAARTADGDRPLLGEGAEARRTGLRQVAARRRRWYRQAHLRVRSDRGSPDRVAERIARRGGLAEPSRALRIPVRSASRSYEAHVLAAGPAGAADLLARSFGRGAMAIVADRRAWSLYGGPFEQALHEAGMTPTTSRPGAGEPLKRPSVALALWRWLAESRFPRHRPVVAFGGGAVGDVAGFVAATYRRGVPWAVVATTLLSQVDSAVGGKTAVNLPQGKNLAGAYHQPHLVVAPLHALASLSLRDWRSGLAEAVKVGAVADAALWERLECEAPRLRGGPGVPVGPIVAACYRRKAEVVARDERDDGPRLVLNFGHTLGHAFERSRTGGRRLRHGEAVSLGMVAAGRVSVRLGLCPRDVAERLEALLAALGLPTDVGSNLSREVWTWVGSDKKMEPEALRFVALRAPGEAAVVPLDPGRLRQLVEETS